MADLFRLSASEAAARIREGKLTSEALVRSCLERIDSRDSQVKAWVHLDRDLALRQARECDRSANRGPIHGVPFAAKDIMDTADLPAEYTFTPVREPAEGTILTVVREMAASIASEIAHMDAPRLQEHVSDERQNDMIAGVLGILRAGSGGDK